MTDIINWKAELKKIEREYETHGSAGRRSSGSGIRSHPLSPIELSNGAMVRLGLTSALAVGISFWPYSKACGSGLFSFLGVAAVVFVGAVWSLLWTWRGRMARSHVLSIALMLWGLTVAASQVAPRTGVFGLSSAQSTRWFCPGYSPREIIDEVKRSR
ncbi:MAG: hypothetical protein ACT4PJ_06925 [Gemmatimonadaceae bacterium]